MTAEEIGIYTVADLERERELDERLRWELLDGELVMTPSPRFVHQDLLGRLYTRWMEVVPGSLLVAMAPLDVTLSDSTVLQPDLVVARPKQVGDTGIVGAPVLAVEILSPPDDVSLRAWHLVDGRYELQTHAVGEQLVRLTEPVELVLRVADLLPS